MTEYFSFFFNLFVVGEHVNIIILKAMISNKQDKNEFKYSKLIKLLIVVRQKGSNIIS